MCLLCCVWYDLFGCKYVTKESYGKRCSLSYPAMVLLGTWAKGSLAGRQHSALSQQGLRCYQLTGVPPMHTFGLFLATVLDCLSRFSVVISVCLHLCRDVGLVVVNWKVPYGGEIGCKNMRNPDVLFCRVRLLTSGLCFEVSLE